MDILQNLPLLIDKNGTNILWKYNERQDLYDKYTQYISTHHQIEDVKKAEVCGNRNVIYNIVPKVIDDKSDITKVMQQKKSEDPDLTHKQSNKSKKPSPMEVIIQLSDNTDVNSVYVKDKLIELISAKYFHTAFGVKKSSDVMKGISENKWNKSYALLVSFLFDVSFIYLNKVVSYDPEKKYDTVITI